MGNVIGKERMMKLKLVFHILISLIGFVSVVLHIVYSPDPMTSITKYTAQTNLIVSITFFLSSLAILWIKDQIPFIDFLKNASVIYMTVCFFTYHFLLASAGEYSGIRVITNFTLHYLIPMLVVMNWLVFEKKKKHSYKFIFYWMIYPIIYCIVSSLRGLLDGYYPYFFLNPNVGLPAGVGSYSNVVWFIIAFLIVFAILGYLLITFNRITLFISNKSKPSSKHNMRKTNVF
ncbi:Pr6Pr family membrane protein [Oceanobacillus sp. J11TS1]|uniref:Pr6Pr family membrane protein n=1 Tax=Oceanobacillus sp. J11TS1 TaxID=2807191 RepID=UPI001BB3812C|nr:Pr6Pr family membrane protein [Oceanobacillus sp. J11TS1]